MAKKLPINKIYIGLILFFINLFCFFFIVQIDKLYNIPFFLYFSLFFTLIIILIATKEIINLDKILKTKFLQIIYFIFSFFSFFSFLSFLLNFFYKKIKNEKQIILNFFKLEYSFFLLLFFLFFLWIFFLFIKDFRTKNLNLLLFIFLYVVFCCACFFTLICLNYQWFLYLFIITISSDSFSFLGGFFFGKHLLFPSVSPKKTWEGFFIGIIFTIIITLCFFEKNIHKNNILYFLIFTFLNCIIASIGDLIASKVKRDFLIKDFNNIIPGHGGFLDRFDSLLFLSFFIILILSSPFESFIDNILEIIN